MSENKPTTPNSTRIDPSTNVEFLKSTARGGDQKSINQLQQMGIDTVTLKEGPYTRTYVAGDVPTNTLLDKYKTENYDVADKRSYDALNRMFHAKQEQEQAQQQMQQAQQQIQMQQAQQQMQQAQQQIQQAQIQLGSRAYAEFKAGQSDPILKKTQRVLPDGSIETITTRATQEKVIDPFAISQNKEIRKKERDEIVNFLAKTPSDVNEFDIYNTTTGEKISTVSRARLPLEAVKLGRHVEGGIEIRPIAPVEKSLEQKESFRQIQKENHKQIQKESAEFIQKAREAGAGTIIITDKKTGQSEAVPIQRANIAILQKSRKSEEGLELSFNAPKVIEFDRMTYSDRVDKGISPKPATLQEKASYYADVAMKPFGDMFFPAAEFVTGKKIEYTPSLPTRTIDAVIISSKYGLGFGEKDASGKPIDQSFAKTFEPIIEEYSKDPLKAIVQIPAEYVIWRGVGRAVQLGTNVIKHGILVPAARSAAKKEIETVLTKTFTGHEPVGRTVTTTFGDQVVLKTAQIGEKQAAQKIATEAVAQKTAQIGEKQAIQEIPTEVIIPVKRTVDAPAIIATPVKGRSDLFSIEGKLLENNDKFVYATKNKNDINLIVSEAPLDLPPKKVTVLGSIEDVRPQAQVQLEKGLTQVSDKPIFQTVDKPKDELLKLIGTGIKDQQQLSVYGIKIVQENPKDFSKYLFGRASRTQLEEALLSKERPVSAKPLDETLVGVTESYGTRKSAVSTVKGTADKIKETGESVLIKRFGKTVIPNPVKKNVENINQRIASEQRKLEKLDPTNPENARDISIIENNIKRLQQRKLEISQKPDTIEVLTTAPKAAIKIESSEQTRTFGNRVKGMFGIGEKVFKPFEGGQTARIISRKLKSPKTDDSDIYTKDITRKIVPNILKRDIKNYKQRIAHEKKELKKLDKNDPDYNRNVEIGKRGIEQLKQRVKEISRQPHYFMTTKTTTKLKGGDKIVNEEIKKTPLTAKDMAKGLVKKVGGNFEILKYKKALVPTDLTVARGRRSDFIKYVDPYTVVGKSKGDGKSLRSFTGKSSLLDNAEKGVAGGSGKAKSLLKTEKEKTNRIVSDLVKTSEPKVRADALGPITNPVYLKAHPAWETQGQSALEPQSMTVKRPARSSVFTVPQPVQSTGGISELGSMILGNGVTPISKSGIFERGGMDNFLGTGEKGDLGVGILGGLGSKLNPFVGEISRTSPLTDEIIRTRITTKPTNRIDDLLKLKTDTTPITDTRYRHRTDIIQIQRQKTTETPPPDLVTKLTFDVPIKPPRPPTRPPEEFWRIPPVKPPFGFGGGGGGFGSRRGGRGGHTEVYKLPAGLKGSPFYLAGDKRLFKQPRTKSLDWKLKNPWF
jgi:hypothetical protein